jgi:membrane fusion protein, multidrug efflux system
MRIVQALLALLVLFYLNLPLVFAGSKPPVRVVTSKIVFQNVAQNRPFIGTFYYERISHVSSEVAGLVDSINVRNTQRVNKGESIILLDTQILEKEILVQKNLVDQAKLIIEHEKKHYQRIASLYQNKTITEKDYDDAKFTYQNALLNKKTSETTLEKLLIKKRKSVIQAPFDGIILKKNVDRGEWVQQGKLIVSIGSVKDIFIKVPIAETLLKFISIGLEVPVIINAYDRKITGIIENIFPAADAKTKNIFLKIKIPILTKVVENMSATLFIPTGLRQKLAIIPRDALIMSQGKYFVYTIKNNKTVMLPVNIVTYLDNSFGADDKHFTGNMEVIVEGNERLRPDQTVSISEMN